MLEAGLKDRSEVFYLILIAVTAIVAFLMVHFYHRS